MAESKEIVDILLKIRQDEAERKRLLDGFLEMQKQVNKVQGSLEDALNKQYGSGLIKSLLTATGITVGLNQAFQSAKQFIERGIDFSATIEQNQVAFETLLGGAEAAQERVEGLVEFAAVTPFRFAGVVDANRQLQVLTDGALATQEGLRIVGDAAAATGRDFSQVAFWIGRVYAGLKSGEAIGEATLRLIEMGLVSGESSRELQRLAKEAHTTEETFAIIERTFEKTAGAMDKQSRTFKGLSNTLSDTMDVMSSDLSRPIFNTIKNSLEAFLEAIDALPTRVENAIKELNSKLDGVIEKAQKSTSAEKGLQELKDMQLELELTIERTLELNKVAGVGKFLNGVGSANSLKRLGQYRAELEAERDALLKNGGSEIEITVLDTIIDNASVEKIGILNALLPEFKKNIEAIRVERVAFEGIGALGSTLNVNEAYAKMAELVKLRESLVPDGQGSLGKLRKRGLSSDEEELFQKLKQRIDLELKTKVSAEERAAAAAKAKEEEIRLNEATARNNELLEASAKLTEEAARANEAYALQSGSLEDQQGKLETRLRLLGEEQATELKNLELLGDKAALEELNAQYQVRRLNIVKQLEAVNNKIAAKEKADAEKLRKEKEKAASDAERANRQALRDRREAYDTEELNLRLVLDRIRHEKTLLELNGVTLAERGKQAELLEAERLALAAILKLKKEERDLATTPREEATLDTEIQGVQQEIDLVGSGSDTRTRAETSQENFDNRKDPTESFQSNKEAALAAMQDYVTQAGTITDNFYESIMNINEAMEGALADSIEGLLNGTETWGDALTNIGTTIGSTIVRSIAEMAAKWIASQIAMAATATGLRAAATAESLAQATTLTTAWTPAAMLSAVASFGSSLIGITLLLAAVGSVAGAFETGGGIDGGEQLIRVNEKGREYVIDNSTLNRFGEGFFDDLRNGNITPESLRSTNMPSSFEPVGLNSLTGGSFVTAERSGAADVSNGNAPANGAEGGKRPFVFGMFGKDGESDAKAWAMSQEGEQWVIDVVKGNAEQLSG